MKQVNEAQIEEFFIESTKSCISSYHLTPLIFQRKKAKT